MNHRVTNIILAVIASFLFMSSTTLASENGQAGSPASTVSVTGTKMSYRYYYPATGCYYVKQCVRVNRWGKCSKFRWIKKCGPRRVI